MFDNVIDDAPASMVKMTERKALNDAKRSSRPSSGDQSGPAGGDVSGPSDDVESLEEISNDERPE